MEVLEGVLRGLLAAGAGVVVVATALSAVRTFVLPRAQRTLLPRLVFVGYRRLFDRMNRRRATYERQDSLLALLGPLGLLTLPVLWLVLVSSAYAAAFVAVDPGAGLRAAVEASGSCLFTLGIVAPPSFAGRLLGFTEAALGLALVALLITYLPSIYGAFSRREALVQKLDVRAGTPPSAVAMVVRYHRIGWLDRLDEMWRDWEDWFVEVQESHTTYGALSFFRSPLPEQSWVTAAGCVLDAAAITTSTLELGGRQPHADLCLRAGYLSLRRIADFFDLPYDPDPAPGDPISITRAEYDEALDELVEAGVPLKEDRDAAWRAFAGWRVNYDTVLLGLAAITAAPVTAWSSDRSPAFSPRLRRRRDGSEGRARGGTGRP